MGQSGWMASSIMVGCSTSGMDKCAIAGKGAKGISSHRLNSQTHKRVSCPHTHVFIYSKI